jgi:hypothetical protein
MFSNHRASFLAIATGSWVIRYQGSAIRITKIVADGSFYIFTLENGVEKRFHEDAFVPSALLA